MLVQLLKGIPPLHRIAHGVFRAESPGKAETPPGRVLTERDVQCLFSLLLGRAASASSIAGKCGLLPEDAIQRFFSSEEFRLRVVPSILDGTCRKDECGTANFDASILEDLTDRLPGLIDPAILGSDPCDDKYWPELFRKLWTPQSALTRILNDCWPDGARVLQTTTLEVGNVDRLASAGNLLGALQSCNRSWLNGARYLSTRLYALGSHVLPSGDLGELMSQLERCLPIDLLDDPGRAGNYLPAPYPNLAAPDQRPSRFARLQNASMLALVENYDIGGSDVAYIYRIRQDDLKDEGFQGWLSRLSAEHQVEVIGTGDAGGAPLEQNGSAEPGVAEDPSKVFVLLSDPLCIEPSAASALPPAMLNVPISAATFPVAGCPPDSLLISASPKVSGCMTRSPEAARAFMASGVLPEAQTPHFWGARTDGALASSFVVVDLRAHDETVDVEPLAGLVPARRALGILQGYVERRQLDVPVVFLANKSNASGETVDLLVSLFELNGRKLNISSRSYAYDSSSNHLVQISDPYPALCHWISVPDSCLTVGDAVQILSEQSFDSMMSQVVPTQTPTLCLPGLPSSQGPELRRPQYVNAHFRHLLNEGLPYALSTLKDPDLLVSTHLQELSRSARAKISNIDWQIRHAPGDTFQAGAATEHVLEWLLRERRPDLIRDILRRVCSSPAILESLPSADLAAVIRFCIVAGIQSEMTELLLSAVPRLCRERPEAIIPLFEMLAGSLTERRLTTAVFAAIGFCASTGARESLLRLVEIVCRYESAEDVIQVLLILDDLEGPKLLKETRTLRRVGDALITSTYPPFTLPASGLRDETLATSASFPRKVMRALEVGDTRSLQDTLQAWWRSGTLSSESLAPVKTHTCELERHRLSVREIAPELSPQTLTHPALPMALVDHTFIREWLEHQHDVSQDAFVAAATYCSDWAPFEAFYADLASRYGATALSFSGDDLRTLFEHIVGQQQTQALASEPVSVVMTAFNPDLELMRLAVRSILLQSHTNIELILVDDHSDEAISQQMEDLARTSGGVKVIRTDRNVGPYEARNIAIRHASGAYIAIQDADDVSHPQRIERQLAAFREHPELQICASTHVRFDSSARIHLEHGNRVCGDGTMTSLFRSDLFRSIGTFLPVKSRGDVEYRERVRSILGPRAYLQLRVPLVFCRSAPSTLSNSIQNGMGEYLRLFRSQFSHRHRYLQYVKPGPGDPWSDGFITIPWALKP